MDFLAGDPAALTDQARTRNGGRLYREFMLAASLSDGHCRPVNRMLEMYQTGDPYLSYCKAIGVVPGTATKKTHAEIRDKYKTMLLAVQYGMSSMTLAGRLGVSTFEAHEMLNRHHDQFALER